jgi:gliding motility-associated-like protein
MSKKRLFFLFHFLLLAFLGHAQKNCDITVSVNTGCIPLPVQFTFTTTNTSAISSYLWDFGDLDSSTQANPTHIFKSHGNFYGKVTVRFANGTFCTATLTKPVRIFSSPVPDFDLKNNQTIILCSSSTAICFKDLSTPGFDKAPIVSWLWSFGDGSTSSQQNPCYTYSSAGTYTVILSVVDTNGCKNFIQKIIKVQYLSGSTFSLTPKFNVSVFTDCKDNSQTATFTNTTDTAGDSITKFIWDFGDGAGDTCTLTDPNCVKRFLGQVHRYANAGSYRPTLFVQNKQGCTAKVTSGITIKVAPFKLSAKISPQKTCYTVDSIINFSTLASNVTWDFGDPYSRARGVTSNVKHAYNRPGKYTIHLMAKNGNCVYDTIFCKYVTLNGPIAKIMPAKEKYLPWNIVPPGGSYLIKPSNYRTYFDTTCAGGGTTFYTYTPTLKKNGETIYDVCGEDSTVKTLSPDSLTGCNGKKYPDTITIRTPHIKGYKDTTIQVPSVHVWFNTSARPTGTLYSAPPYVRKALYMDDTSIFSPKCKGPLTVNFTNFSIKYRGYESIDNFPLEYPDVCRHKTYPYASDSLTYFWNFKEGNPNTSTKTSPDKRAQYSEEKMPAHLFQKDGCYMVVLQVSDPVTGCTDYDSVPVVLQQPDAGWGPEYNQYTNMTRVIQNRLPAKSPRRGLLLTGKPCSSFNLAIDLSETLPSCFKNSYAMIFDSAKEVKVCGSPQVLKVPWHDKKEIVSLYHNQILYQDTGWKTLGLVMTNNSYCSDTVWYHNYIYIHPISADAYVSTSHICPGDSVKISASVPDQQGIQLFTLSYSNTPGPGIIAVTPPNDTFKYEFIKRQGGHIDTVTTTSNNPLWGTNDSPKKFNHLRDTIYKKFDQPGHMTIISNIYSRFGCSDVKAMDVTIGHYSDFKVSNNIVCMGDDVSFTGIAQYFLPYSQNSTGLDPRLFWSDPIGTRGGKKPKIAEKIEWDLDGDGIIDYTGTNPTIKYKKTGSYTVVIYTTDSTGCKQKTVKKDYIKVINAKASFSIAAPGNVRYCTGSHFFHFIDSSYVIKAFKDSLNKFRVLSWTWNFGDGTAPVTITDSSKRSAGHIYLKNGDYKVTLTASTTLTPGQNGGCSDTFSVFVHILGPIADFVIEGPNEGCVPFTLKVHELSKKAKVHEWLLGDGTSVSTSGDTIVYLTYKRVGVFCPQLFVADTLKDQQGRLLYCADTFPAKCALKVYVNAINIQHFTASDTLICLGDPVTFKSVPDTGYKTWTINYGNGDTANAIKPQFVYKYDKVGQYHVGLKGTGAKCPVTAALNVRVIDVKSDFVVDTAKKDTPVFHFINLSPIGVRYAWDFDDGTPTFNTTSRDEIGHEMMKSGKSTVCLTAYNERGCPDKVCHDVFISTFVSIPNVFTPNGDLTNDTYVISIWGHLLYDLTIYNRWGQAVFHSNRKDDTWDGKDQTTGTPCADGAYYYDFKYRFIGGKVTNARGAVTLLRR